MTASDDVIEQAARALFAWDNPHDHLTWENTTPEHRATLLDGAHALADAGLLATPLPSRDEIADEIVGRQVGHGYYSLTIDSSTAGDALLDQPPARDVKAEARAEAVRIYGHGGYHGSPAKVRDVMDAYMRGYVNGAGGAR